MKNILIAFFLLCAATIAYADVSETNHLKITKDSYPLAYTAVFEIQKGDVPLGRVVRTGLFTPRYYYDLYDANGAFQVRGITRAFSLGLLFAWGTEIDLYDNAERLVGMIRGQCWTQSRAKFAFYDAGGSLVAHANLSDESCDFLIVSAQRGKMLGELSGKSFGDTAAWEMKFSDPALDMDERALLIFAGFVVDFQKSFVRPPKRETVIIYQELPR